MNPMINTRHLLLRLAAVAFVAVGLASGTASAAEKGAERMQTLTKVKTYGDLENLKSGDKVVMSCSKCQTVMMHTMSGSKRRDIPTLTAKHLCEGCKSTIETVGHGKAATDIVKHTCTGCGDDSVVCCATSKGAKPTEGMPKH